MNTRQPALRTDRTLGRWTSVFRVCRALPVLSSGCCVLATTLPWGTTFADLPGPGAVRGAFAVDPVTAPSPAQGILAYRTLRPWLSAGEARADDQTPALCGASVQLRVGGRLIGRGSAVTLAEPSAGILPQATNEAIRQAHERFPGDRDALSDERRREAIARAQVSLEIAGALVPIEPGSLEDLDALVAPGLEGLGVRVGERLGAVFPGTMLARGVLPSEAMAELVSTLSQQPALGLLSPAELIERHGVRFSRFRVTHLAQLGAGEEPVFLQRGRAEVTLGEVANVEKLVRTSEAMGQWVSRRLSSDQPLSAPERALCELALARWTNSRGGPADANAGRELLEPWTPQRVREAFRDTPPELLVTHMPMLGYAELAGAGSGEIPAAPALRQMRALLWQGQLTVSSAPAHDLIGGVVLRPGQLPDATLSRPLAFIAAMQRDDRLTLGAEKNTHWAALLQALRFVRTLQIDQSMLWLGERAEGELGGVRLHVWDNAPSPGATAMSLLAITETLTSMRAGVP